MDTDLHPCYREEFSKTSNSTALSHRNGNELLYTGQDRSHRYLNERKKKMKEKYINRRKIKK
jgi:hypothetical protein